VDKEVSKVNHIAEVCAELALYRVFIRVDDILNHYSGVALTVIDEELWRFCERLQASEVLTKEAMRKRKA
jgi:hypothetical protein